MVKNGGTKKSSEAENLANRILKQLEHALCVKLKELKEDIKELRSDFNNLKGKETIAGCKSWAEFCQKKLHRTDRAVRKMLADPKPSQAEEQHNPAEQSSASSETEDTERERKTAEKPPALSKAEEEEIARNQAIAKTIGYLSRFDGGKEFRVRLADFVRELREEFSDNLAPELWDRLVQVLELKATVSEPMAEEEVAV